MLAVFSLLISYIPPKIVLVLAILKCCCFLIEGVRNKRIEKCQRMMV